MFLNSKGSVSNINVLYLVKFTKYLSNLTNKKTDC